MKALLTATVPSMIGQFNMNNIEILQKLGYEVEIACNFDDYSVWSEERINKFENELKELNIKTFNISFSRSPKDIKNLIISYKQIKNLLDSRNYTLVHTHTPISSLITRIAYKNSNIYESCKMIYTAHGFHFFIGNNSIKNLIYRNIEKIGARYTDVLITINKEDYEAAKRFKLKRNGIVKYVPGVGINLDEIEHIKGNKEALCKEIGIPENSFLLLSVGELNINKNHKIVIDTLPTLPKTIHYLICGVGALKEQYERQAKDLSVMDRVHLLGYKNDIIKIMKSVDVFIFPSKREGLSVSLMEAIACGLPCIASNIRGNADLIENGFNGFLVNINEQYNKYIMLVNDNKVTFKKTNMSKFDKKSIGSKMINIYKEESNEKE